MNGNFNIFCCFLELTLEIFEKAIKRERIMPLAAQRNFLLLYNGDSIEAAERRERLQSAAEARRRARSAQRRKRFVPGQYVVGFIFPLSTIKNFF